MKRTESPEALKLEHEDFHDQLHKAAQIGGTTGEAAQEVLRVLRPHILLEEEFAIPPLTLLPALAQGKVTREMARMIPKSEMLKEEMGRMLDEHKLIVAALRKLMQAASDEKLQGYAKFAQRLILHAQMEEEILYPASVLIGEYLKLRLNGK
jgi:hypothetical protein